MKQLSSENECLNAMRHPSALEEGQQATKLRLRSVSCESVQPFLHFRSTLGQPYGKNWKSARAPRTLRSPSRPLSRQGFGIANRILSVAVQTVIILFLGRITFLVSSFA